MVRLLRHCQPKGAATARPNLQCRASTPPLHFVCNFQFDIYGFSRYTPRQSGKTTLAKTSFPGIRTSRWRAWITGSSPSATRAAFWPSIARESSSMRRRRPPTCCPVPSVKDPQPRGSHGASAVWRHLRDLRGVRDSKVLRSSRRTPAALLLARPDRARGRRASRPRSGLKNRRA